MGLFDAFTGKSQRRDLETAYGESSKLVRDAQGKIGQGLDAAKTGYGQARGALATGRDQATGTVRNYLTKTTDYLDPYISDGGDARGLYRQHVGLDGVDAQREAVDEYSGDPFREFNEGRTTNALMKRYNAAGMLDSGASRIAAARANLESGTRDYQTYLDRLAGLSSQGGQFASQAAGYTSGTGGQIAGYEYGTGQGEAGIYGQEAGTEYDAALRRADLDLTQAGNRINYGNSLADSRSTGINNLLKIGELAVSAMTGGRRA